MLLFLSLIPTLALGAPLSASSAQSSAAAQSSAQPQSSAVVSSADPATAQTSIISSAVAATSTQDSTLVQTTTSSSAPAATTTAVNPGYYTKADLDNCAYPQGITWTIPTNPEGVVYDQPNLMVWNALQMDAWLQALFDSCPAALACKDDNGAGPVPVAFAEVLGRLMLGSTPYAAEAPVCTNFRCDWSAPSNGETSNRGRIYTPTQIPDLEMDSSAEDIEVYRRWYSMQALANIWDYYQATSRSLNDASSIVSNELSSILNTFLPDYQPAQTTSPFDDILDVISAIGSFTPWAPLIDLAVTGAKILDDASSGNSVAGDLPDVGSAVVEAFTPEQKENAENAGAELTDEQRAQMSDSVDKSRKATVGNIGNAFKLAGAAIQLFSDVTTNNDATGTTTPVVPIKFADLQSKFGDLFAQMAVQLDSISTATLNGDPSAPGGFLNVVKGGLYSSWAGSTTTIGDESLSATLPYYVAYLEDKLLSLILKSQGFWLYKMTFDNQGDCQNAQINWGWAGQDCIFDQPNNQYQLFIPMDGQIGIANNHGPTLVQGFTAMTSANIATLRSSFTQSIPITIEDIYSASFSCSIQQNNDFFANDGQPKCDGTSNMKSWTTEFSNSPAVNALDMDCHWSIPVIDFDYTAVNTRGCLNPNLSNPANPTFHTFEINNEGCSLYSVTNWQETSFCSYYGGCYYDDYSANIVGAAAWYGRDLAYPTTSTCNTDLHGQFQAFLDIVMGAILVVTESLNQSHRYSSHLTLA